MKDKFDKVVSEIDKNKPVKIALIAVVALLLFTILIKTRFAVSEHRLESNITKAVKNKDGKLFLKQFSKEDRDIKYSEIGAQSIVDDLNKHSSSTYDQIGKDIVEGYGASAKDTDYSFIPETKKVLGLFTSHYLTTKRSPIDIKYYGESINYKVKITNDKLNEKVSDNELSQGFFPGRYDFDISDDSGNTDSYWAKATGDGDTIDLDITSMKVEDNNSDNGYW